MIYIYDILLNFCDCDLIYDFYEWSQSDVIDNMKRIKLAHIDTDTFDKLLTYDGTIDNNFIVKIYRTCEMYTSKKVKVLDYCCLFSDGNRVIAVEFDNKGKPIYKSKLLIDEEVEIAVLAKNLEKIDLKYKPTKKILEPRFFTRNDIIIRKYLMKEIEESYYSKNYSKLRFLYEEYFDKKNTSYLKMKQELLDSIKSVIDSKHFNLYQLLKLSNKKKQV